MALQGARSPGAIFSAVDHRATMLAAANGVIRIMMKALMLCGDPRAQEKGGNWQKKIDRRADHRRRGDNER
jgi:hypothetical protein